MTDSTAPSPLPLKKYLLATGERGLGMDYVERLPADAFEQLWMIAQYVQMASSEDGHKQLALQRDALYAAEMDILDALDGDEKSKSLRKNQLRDLDLVDPTTLDPVALQEWAERLARAQGQI